MGDEEPWKTERKTTNEQQTNIQYFEFPFHLRRLLKESKASSDPIESICQQIWIERSVV